MNLYALIKNSKIVNMIESDPALIGNAVGYDFVIDVTAMPEKPAIGWGYDGVNFIDPTPVLTAEQLARAAALKQAAIDLKTTKPVMNVVELSDTVNKILLYLGIK